MVTTVRGAFPAFEGTATIDVASVSTGAPDRDGHEGATTINRKDWGLTWNAALETGGVLVSEKIKLEFDVSAIRNA